MSGTKAAWTPQRRAKQAAHMRAMNADPQFVARKVAGLDASPKARAARVRNASRISGDPDARAKRLAWCQTPEGKSALSRAGKASIAKRLADDDTRMHHKLRCAVSGRCAKRRARSSQTLKQRWQEPDFVLRQTAKAITIGRDPAAHKKAWATRRAGKIPHGYVTRYRELRDMVGAQAAMAVVQREAKMARVNQ